MIFRSDDYFPEYSLIYIEDYGKEGTMPNIAQVQVQWL